MSKRILIEKQGDVSQIALMEDQKLLAFFRESPVSIEAEQIYLGIVDRIIKGMEAAFVRLGNQITGFLPFSECVLRPRSGDKILVQVKRPPVGEKSAYLSADLSLAGRFVLLTPASFRFSVSKRIEDQNEKERLLQLARKHAPERIGIVMRQESSTADEQEIADEIRRLYQKWQSIQACASASEAPCLVQGRENVLSRLMRDERGGIDEILTDSSLDLPKVSCPVQTVSSPFSLYSVHPKLEKSLQRKIWLDCGGFLVLDRTEAMTVIDVNSGKFTGSKSGTEATFLKVNLEAAREIARILRLKNIGGIIIIDFVDMQEESSRTQVKNALLEALKNDPEKSVIHGFTSLGLLEMTRKKTEAAASPLSLCPRCHGTGHIEEKL